MAQLQAPAKAADEEEDPDEAEERQQQAMLMQNEVKSRTDHLPYLYVPLSAGDSHCAETFLQYGGRESFHKHLTGSCVHTFRIRTGTDIPTPRLV